VEVDDGATKGRDPAVGSPDITVTLGEPFDDFENEFYSAPLKWRTDVAAALGLTHQNEGDWRRVKGSCVCSRGPLGCASAGAGSDLCFFSLAERAKTEVTFHITAAGACVGRGLFTRGGLCLQLLVWPPREMPAAGVLMAPRLLPPPGEERGHGGGAGCALRRGDAPPRLCRRQRIALGGIRAAVGQRANRGGGRDHGGGLTSSLRLPGVVPLQGSRDCADDQIQGARGRG